MKQYGNFLFVLQLGNFWGARIVEIEDEFSEDGKQEGIFIPFKENGLEVDNHNNVKVYVILNEQPPHFKEQRKYGSHWSYQCIQDTKIREYIQKELGRDKPLTLGYMYPRWDKQIKTK